MIVMEFRQLEAFRAIATSGSFSAAAQKLHTTQPAITSRIRALETELGTELFDRTSRPATLTATGHRLMRHVERVFDATNDIRRLVGGARGRIGAARIGLPGALVSKWAPRIMAEIYKGDPQAKVELHIDRTVILRQMLANGEIDFALVIGPVDDPSLVAAPIARYDYCWIADRQTANSGRFKSAADVQGHVFTYPKDSSVYRALADYFKERGSDAIELCGSNSTDATIQLVSKGLGIGVVMTAAIENSVGFPGIRKLDLETDMIPTSEYWAIYRRDGDVLLGEYLLEACVKTITDDGL
ncbi:LysR family transcriptional regulator [Brucellaceae bacterium VT-16-1752]|nr:LysR family transcriptional regulator [Brucellaceae bacterium VT-16-1752]